MVPYTSRHRFSNICLALRSNSSTSASSKLIVSTTSIISSISDCVIEYAIFAEDNFSFSKEISSWIWENEVDTAQLKWLGALLLLSYSYKLLVWYEACIAAQEMDLYGRIKWRNWQQIKCVSDQYEILRNTYFSFKHRGSMPFLKYVFTFERETKSWFYSQINCNGQSIRSIKHRINSNATNVKNIVLKCLWNCRRE